MLFDTSGDGVITNLELKQGIQSLGIKITDESLEEIIDMVDFDKSGTIKYDEFLAATVDIGKFMTRGNIKATFQIFDFDDDGHITPENIVQSFTNICEIITIEEATAIIRQHDSNNDLKICIEEFKAMLTFNKKCEEEIKV